MLIILPLNCCCIYFWIVTEYYKTSSAIITTTIIKAKRKNNNNNIIMFYYYFRTKWKRQTAVGLELLAEAGSYSALQRMFPSPYFYPPGLLGSVDGTAAAAAAAAAMYSSVYRSTGPAPHPATALHRPLVPRVLIHGLGASGQPALNPLGNPVPGATHPR